MTERRKRQLRVAQRAVMVARIEVELEKRALREVSNYMKGAQRVHDKMARASRRMPRLLASLPAPHKARPVLRRRVPASGYGAAQQAAALKPAAMLRQRLDTLIEAGRRKARAQARVEPTYEDADRERRGWRGAMLRGLARAVPFFRDRLQQQQRRER